MYVATLIRGSQYLPLLANLHITTLGHGYSSAVHVPHDSTFVFGDVNACMLMVLP